MAIRMQRLSVAAVLLGAAFAISAVNAKTTRYEIRDLSPQAWDQVVDVMWTMKNTTNHTLGQELYGPAFQPYDAFVVKHAVSSLDLRGDQGHFGPSFMTMHRIYLLEIENCFLAILNVKYGSNALVDAMPYWNPSPDSPAYPGAYSQLPPGSHPKSIFSDNYLGGYDGDETANFTVTNGRFAYWWIAKYNETYIDPEYYESSRTAFKGNPTTGFLRGEANTQYAPYLVRQKTKPELMFDHQQYLQWNDADFDKCTDVTIVKEWMQWQACNNNAMVSGKSLGDDFNRTSTAQPNGNVLQVFNLGPGAPHWMHTQAHVKVGSYQKFPESMVLRCPGECPGDMTDVATSPNDIFFWFFHANLDRMNLKWLSNLGWTLSNQANKEFDAVKYPHSKGVFNYQQMIKPYADVFFPLIWTAAANGTTLDDVVNANYPYKKCILTKNYTDHTLLTHRDVLEATYRDQLPYKYAEPSVVQGRTTDNDDEALGLGYIVLIAVAAIFIIVVLGYAFSSYYKSRQGREDEKRAVTIHKEELDMTKSDSNETSVVVRV